MTKKEYLERGNKRASVALQKKSKKELYEAKEWYTIRAILGNQWANWFVLIGARERSWENFHGTRLRIKLLLQP